MWPLVCSLYVSTLRGEKSNGVHQVQEPFSRTMWGSGIEFHFSIREISIKQEVLLMDDVFLQMGI